MTENPLSPQESFDEVPDRVLRRSQYVLDVLMSIRALFKGSGVFASPIQDNFTSEEKIILRKNDRTDHVDGFVGGIISKCSRPIRHWIETGGSGGEALTRLIGEGVLERFPVIGKKEGENIEVNSIVITKVANGYKLDAYFKVWAVPPDDTGQETWNQQFSREVPFDVFLTLFYLDAHYEEKIEEYEKLVRESLNLKRAYKPK